MGNIAFDFFMSPLTHLEDIRENEKTKLSIVYHRVRQTTCVLRICKNRDLSGVCEALCKIRNSGAVVVYDYVYENGDTYILEEKLEMEYAPRKIALPGVCREEEAFVVMKQHLDSNHHVNNCQYVRMAEDYLPKGFVVSQMRAEYKQQARLYHRICPQVAAEEQKVTVLLNDENGAAYAVVEFLGQIR